MKTKREVAIAEFLCKNGHKATCKENRDITVTWPDGHMHVEFHSCAMKPDILEAVQQAVRKKRAEMKPNPRDEHVRALFSKWGVEVTSVKAGEETRFEGPRSALDVTYDTKATDKELLGHALFHFFVNSPLNPVCQDADQPCGQAHCRGC